ncbi:G-type lectin S-receptor-like serine/threonine-protein kinase At1g61370 isoform X1 [Rutidosis leptorrhynchoides]|uniref:G-type lectin S-receptor-like serine/threonine-protein kinase At1g61370 isoform X1 n=1 Tax=Rutidosis leptorrhynchoides TaxID=125765 RepID=UPI003A99F8A3
MVMENGLCVTCIYILMITTQICKSIDILTKDSYLSLEQTLVSNNSIFELGFFNPGNSSNRYIGIWFKNVTARQVIWVANRQNPLSISDTSSTLLIDYEGNMRILDGKNNTVWKTNVTVMFNETIAQLTDMGNFCLNDSISSSILWESFDYPGNILLPGMRLGTKDKTQGNKHLLTSWKSVNDPTPGDFVVGLSVEQPPQAFIWRGSEAYWRSGPWDGGKFIGVPEMGSGYSNLMSLMPDNSQDGAYVVINLRTIYDIQWIYLTSDGTLRLYYWDDDKSMWDFTWEEPNNSCDVYGVCGAFAMCTNNKSSMCECLKGFVPQSNDEWSNSNWTSGCVRRSELSCEINASSLASRNSKPDKFEILKRVKLPDNYHYFPGLDSEPCRDWCLGNCSCNAYAFVTGIHCMAWTEEIVDIEQLSDGDQNLSLRVAFEDSDPHRSAVLITLTTIGGLLLLSGFVLWLYRWKKYKKVLYAGMKIKVKNFNPEAENVSLQEDVRSQESYELPIYNFKQILASTDNFSNKNKLGEGGFGPVYKGMLDDGQKIAVKRLSGDSGQGVEEFKNEIMLISKLQHRNLVKLLGCCIEGKERLLIYEYMTNKSLDKFLFDPKKSTRLDWATRFSIIQGIGRGLIYLHRDSCLRIIHRDLKCSNILLDEQMNPKISDFGLARTFQMTQELANTRRIVGTYGYMSPEYAMGGVISEKSDVFSYGVMLLEILSGKRNTELIQREQVYPLAHAWNSWKEGRGTELLDQTLTGSSCQSEGLRCIHVGLLCVQDLPKDRPTMTEAVSLLTSETNLQEPKEPLFTLQRLSGISSGQGLENMFSVNEVTISMVVGR